MVCSVLFPEDGSTPGAFALSSFACCLDSWPKGGKPRWVEEQSGCPIWVPFLKANGKAGKTLPCFVICLMVLSALDRVCSWF